MLGVQTEQFWPYPVKRENGKITALIVYVDDMIITGDDQNEMNKLQKNLSREFEMKILDHWNIS